MNDKYGYNIESGGCSRYWYSEIHIDDISYDVYQYEYPTGKFIKKYKSAKKASKLNNFTWKGIQGCCRGNSITYGGFYWSYEYVEKYTFEKNKYTPVYQFTLDGEFVKEWSCLSEPYEDVGAHRSNIKRCCDGTYSQTGGFIWKYKYDEQGEKIPKYINMKRNMSKRMKKPVYQFDLDGNFIREWESSGLIENELGIARSNITNVCKGKKYNKTAGGYIWRYKYNSDGEINSKSI